MQTFDPEYLGRSLAQFSGIPVHVFREEELLSRFFPAYLPRDPIEPDKANVLSVSEHVGFYVTPQFQYYGVLNAGNIRLVIGPTAQIMANEQQLRELAFLCHTPQGEVPLFLDGMRAIRPVPVEMLLQMLFGLNHLINGGEMLELSDIAIHDAEQTLIKTGVEEHRTRRVYTEEAAPSRAHNTFALEEVLLDTVRRGDTAALRHWLSTAPAVQSGLIAGDQLRQLRNVFIVTATLVSRAAIRGGMREDDAFSLSDAYIQRVELLTTHEKIENLQYQMVLEFTEQVEKLHGAGHATRLSLDVANYVRHHLSEPVSVEKMAQALYLSRPYLPARFKQETGQTLTDFILKEKTQEAKRLLQYSDRSAAAIAAYLGFSSHGHFCRVFKKYAEMTPGEFREICLR